jgi:hypothetical protein
MYLHACAAVAYKPQAEHARRLTCHPPSASHLHGGEAEELALPGAGQGAFKKKKKGNKEQKKNPGKKQPTSCPFLFVCGLSSVRAGCGHATACGHPAS